MASEKHLDAEWKRIQKKTFTRWCNEHLKVQGVLIDDLNAGLSDGVKLITLVEVLSQKKVGRYNKKPRVHAQRMENVDQALRFISKTEKIRVVNIGSGDIVDGNLKLILGLIWTLILHYQISIGFGIVDGSGQKKGGPTAKQALVNYIGEKLGDKTPNLTSDWNDGILVAKLVDSIAPGLCPECDTMEPQNALENATHAMRMADEWLGIPQLLLPEDMVNPHVDELSMMTYLSQFPEAELKPGAPIKPRGDVSMVKVYGPGVEKEGLETGNVAEFTVDVSNTGKGVVEATVEGPEEAVEVLMKDNKNGTYSFSYVPAMEGVYIVRVTFNKKLAGGSPFHVNVAQGSDAGACIAYGPGVEGTDLKEGVPCEFWVETAGAGRGALGITVRSSKGILPSNNLKVTKVSEDKYHVCYTTLSSGPHTVEVTFAELHILNSPFRIYVNADRADASKCHAEGPGLEAKGIKINKQTWFKVYTAGAGRGEISINIKGTHGNVPIECSESEPGVYLFTYTPGSSGEYVITIKFGGNQIPGSRFYVQVEPPTDASKCVASGVGLSPHGVRVNIPTKFTVRTKDAGHGETQVQVVGPNGAIPVEVEKASYTYNYTYNAAKPGDYTVDVKFAGENIPGSPFAVAITDANKVKITGPGTNGECLPVDEDLVYHINAQGAGPGKVACTVLTPTQQLQGSDEPDSGGPLVTDNGNGTFKVVYNPLVPGINKMNVTFGETAIPSTPLKLNIFDASKVVTTGPGLRNGNKSNVLTNFMVDMQHAGEGHLHVAIGGPANTPVTVKDQSNNIVNCEYNPVVAGEYVIDIQYEGVHIPNSPFKVHIDPSTDHKAVRVFGLALEKELATDMWAEFFVDYRTAGEGELAVAVQGPGGGENLTIEEVEPGLKKFSYYVDPDEAGEYNIDVQFADQPVPNSPFQSLVKWNTDPSRVKAVGSGLEGGVANSWAEFELDMTTAGEGSLNLQIEGPCESQVQVDDHENGTATVKFLPNEPGEYSINILFADQAIPGSPFTPNFDPVTDASKCRIYGKGLERDGIKVGDKGEFVIDTSEAGAGSVDVAIDGPAWRGQSPFSPSPGPSPTVKSPVSSLRRRSSSFSSIKPNIKNNNDGTYSVVYNPRRVGAYLVHVYFTDKEIYKSPVEVNVTDPSKVKLSGPCIPAKNSQEVSVIPFAESFQWVANCTRAGPGKLMATINDLYEGDSTELEPVHSEEDEDIYLIKFSPKKCGRYQMAVKLSDSEVSQSPVNFALFDATQVHIAGKGLEGGRVGDTISVDIDMRDAGEGGLSLALEGPVQCELKYDDHKDRTMTLSFTPEVAGEYSLGVKFSDCEATGSPFSIPIIDTSKVVVSGSGVSGEGAKVGIPAQVLVDTCKSGPAPVEAAVTFPTGDKEMVELAPDENQPGVFIGNYTPTVPGYCNLDVTFADESVPDSPFSVPICDPDAVQITSPDLESAIMNFDNVIDVSTAGAGPGEITAEFRGSLPVESSVVKLSNDQYQIHFTPRGTGETTAVICYGGFPVVSETTISCTNPSAIALSGSGVTGVGARVGEPAHVIADTSKSGKALVEAQVTSPSGEKSKVELLPTKDECVLAGQYIPSESGYYGLEVDFAKNPVPGSPFSVPVCEPACVQMTGSGLECAIMDMDNVINVSTVNAGPGEITAEFDGDMNVEYFVSQVDDYEYQVHFTPRGTGSIVAKIYYAGFQIGDAAEISCSNPATCKVEGPGVESGLIANREAEFSVDATEAGHGMLAVCVKKLEEDSEEALEIPCIVSESQPQKYSVAYTPKSAGEYSVDVKFAGREVQGSPFFVNVCDPAAVTAYGEGLEKAVVDIPAHFTVDASKAGEGSLNLEINGPMECEVDCVENDDSTYYITYIARKPGMYSINITFATIEVPKSPFKAICERPPPDAAKCFVTGLETPGSFSVDCSAGGGFGLLEVGASGAYVPVEYVSVKHNGDYTFSVSYDIAEAGETIISVKWHGQHLTGSPFTVVTK